jgi:glycosyltransferase involved in cell wall biosynthesis
MIEEDGNGFLINLTDTEHSDYGAPMTLPEDKLQALADGIVDLARNKEKRRRFGVRSRQRAVKEFSWQENIVKIIEWYKTKP